MACSRRKGVRPDAEIFELRDAIDIGLAEFSDRDWAILRALYLDGKEKEDICQEWHMTDAQFRVACCFGQKNDSAGRGPAK